MARLERSRERAKELRTCLAADSLDADALARAALGSQSLSERANPGALGDDFHLFGPELAAPLDGHRELCFGFLQTAQHVSLKKNVTIELEERSTGNGMGAAVKRDRVLRAFEIGIVTVAHLARRTRERCTH